MPARLGVIAVNGNAEASVVLSVDHAIICIFRRLWRCEESRASVWHPHQTAITREYGSLGVGTAPENFLHRFAGISRTLGLSVVRGLARASRALHERPPHRRLALTGVLARVQPVAHQDGGLAASNEDRRQKHGNVGSRRLERDPPHNVKAVVVLADHCKGCAREEQPQKPHRAETGEIGHYT